MLWMIKAASLGCTQSLHEFHQLLLTAKRTDPGIQHYVGVWHHKVGEPNDFQESLGIDWFKL